MKGTSLFLFFLLLSLNPIFLDAQTVHDCKNKPSDKQIISEINYYGKFDDWSTRVIKESDIIGGETEQIYEFYGNQERVETGKTPYSAPEGYWWRTNNVLAIIAGIVKTNNTVYPEPRNGGYCARIETHIEDVKVLGFINMDVCCQGALLLGKLPEPINTVKDPMSKVLYGIPFTSKPVALEFDYKAIVGKEVIRGTGFSRLKNMGYPDYPEIIVFLQKRWEDEDGNIKSLRIGTGYERIMQDIPEWKNNYRLKIEYGDITGKPFYKDYMGLRNDPEIAWHAINSKGKDVVIEEVGWGTEDDVPNTLTIIFIASCHKAFFGGVGNTLWLDNVELIME